MQKNTLNEPFIYTERKENSKDIQQLRTTALKVADDVIDVITSAHRCETLQSIITHLFSTITVGKGLESLQSMKDDEQPFRQKEKFPSNKHFEKQPRTFISTKNKLKLKRKKSQLDLPNFQEMKKFKANLDETTPSVCAQCFCEDDSGAGEGVHWRQCNVCRCWFHVNCDNVELDAHTEYHCSYCRSSSVQE